MNGAVAKKLGVLETGDHSKYALLLGIAKPRLEADEIPHSAVFVLAPELDDGMRLTPGAWIAEADRLHRAEAQRVAPATRHLLDGHAPLEVRDRVELVCARLIGYHQRVEERLVLFARHRAVEICAV